MGMGEGGKERERGKVARSAGGRSEGQGGLEERRGRGDRQEARAGHTF